MSTAQKRSVTRKDGVPRFNGQSLDLTPDQKSKTDAVIAEHQKARCSEATEAKYMKEAKAILTKEQYAKFKADCNGEKAKTNA
jgi:hypothetical protein